MREVDGYKIYSVAEIMESFRTSACRTTWGPWRFRKRALTLELVIDGRYAYDVSLSRCKTSAQVLDWIAQVNQKSWATPAIVKSLIDALDDLLDLQGSLCGCGQGAEINPRELLASRKGSR